MHRYGVGALFGRGSKAQIPPLHGARMSVMWVSRGCAVAPTNSFPDASQVVRLAQGFNYHPLSSISARTSIENLAKTAVQIIFNNPLDLYVGERASNI